MNVSVYHRRDFRFDREDRSGRQPSVRGAELVRRTRTLSVLPPSFFFFLSFPLFFFFLFSFFFFLFFFWFRTLVPAFPTRPGRLFVRSKAQIAIASFYFFFSRIYMNRRGRRLSIPRLPRLSHPSRVICHVYNAHVRINISRRATARARALRTTYDRGV